MRGVNNQSESFIIISDHVGSTFIQAKEARSKQCTMCEISPGQNWLKVRRRHEYMKLSNEGKWSSLSFDVN